MKKLLVLPIVALLADDQIVAEASGAVGVAALRSGKWRGDGRPVAAVRVGRVEGAWILNPTVVKCLSGHMCFQWLCHKSVI